MLKPFLDIVKISRPGFWPTHIWFFLLPFAERNMFGSAAFWLGAIYVCFPLSLLLYGWNDIGDWETDQINPRKDSWLFGARPDRAMRDRLPWIIAAVQIPFLILFTWISGPKMLLIVALIVATNFTYNTLGFKRIAVMDLANQAGYALMFVLASWLCNVPQLHGAAIVFGILFAMQSHLFGQLMDVEQDAAAGRKSTAILLGVPNSKMLLACLMFTESAIAFTFFRGYYVGIFMALGGLFFFSDAVVGPKQYPAWFIKAFFVGWNIIVILTMHFIWADGSFLLAN